ncbi:DNA methylase N-4/N-6 domain protein [Caldicellulosiruptor saccharolyticus DSM 8903]|uniref:Methyltransferase n=1 Tax=Caldicellulosiruptor saccharolyticus (strain ATCC 43494 / DSM 8903 / Tp8T 6331) TaxID=351627 RepID=A4XN35_CALS8|nr:site-specific DNA-methyltransferase [Caldicellulosiruptor saccharolyticus]ABP68320.1 DNA methylase N-4/N-6 domain protein [Caldicellulosiruptor saccharolyticus DSM 8903]
MCKVHLFNDDCLNVLKKIEDNSIDLIFADPPYNLSSENALTTRAGKPVKCYKGEWDKIDDIFEFNLRWIEQCVRVLKETGTIWISGTLHNHPIIGTILKQLGLWIINDIIWFKPNATPLLSRNRFVPSTELIWVASKNKRYYFDYEMARKLNGGKQMRNLWEIPAQRHKTPHPTEKPEALLERIILIGSKEGDVVLDPFMGSGTTGVVAKLLKRNFIGIEIDPVYFEIAKKRIEEEKPIQQTFLNFL